MKRIEKDFLGSKEIPENALYGIHSLRAKENFPGITRFDIEWYKSVGLVKLAVYNTYTRFKRAAIQKFGNKIPLSLIDNNKLNALREAASEIAEGLYFEHFIVPALQGGAGTSINMNITEIIANITLKK